MLIDIGKVDWKLLRKQKRTLLKIIGKETSEAHDLNGILGLIDRIQDEAAKELPEDYVFGKDKD